jgi:hypothetical protein
MSTSKIINFNQFYELDDPLANRPLRITVRGYSDWVTSDFTWTLFRGQDLPMQPIKLGGYMGGQVTDFLWSDLIYMVCISARTVEILEEHKVTGWATYPVEVYGKNGEAILGYYGFSVTGGECRRDRSRSQIITKQAVVGGKPYEVYKGLYFYEEDWDGSDIFIVQKFGGIVITENVFKIFKKARITNVKLTPLQEVERDVYFDKYDKV